MDREAATQMNGRDPTESARQFGPSDPESTLTGLGTPDSDTTLPPLGGSSSNGFSLNAFEISEENDGGLNLGNLQEETSPPGEEPTATQEQKSRTHLFCWIPLNRKTLLVSIGILTLLATGAAVHRFRYANRPETHPIVTHIRKPVPIPQYSEEMDFIVLAEAQSDKSVLSLTLEFEFRSISAYERCKDENVLFRDVVYRFLQMGRPVKNTQKAWTQIVQNELPPHLKSNLPGMHPEIIRVQRFEKL